MVILTRPYEFFEGGNKPIFGGRYLTQRIDGHATIGVKEVPPLPMLDVMDVGETRVSQFFRQSPEHAKSIAQFSSAKLL